MAKRSPRKHRTPPPRRPWPLASLHSTIRDRTSIRMLSAIALKHAGLIAETFPLHRNALLIAIVWLTVTLPFNTHILDGVRQFKMQYESIKPLGAG